MASGAVPAPDGVEHGCPAGVTRFVYVKCSETGKLSRRGLFLNRAAVRWHIAQSKSCSTAKLGFREIHIQAGSGDVMAGGGGSAGPALLI
jgi:hypothetical protein